MVSLVLALVLLFFALVSDVFCCRQSLQPLFLMHPPPEPLLPAFVSRCFAASMEFSAAVAKEDALLAPDAAFVSEVFAAFYYYWRWSRRFCSFSTISRRSNRGGRLSCRIAEKMLGISASFSESLAFNSDCLHNLRLLSCSSGC